MSRTIAFIVPGRLDTRTGGYEYDRRMVAGLRDRKWTVDVHEIEDDFPTPSADALEGADLVLAGIPDGALVLVDGLAGGAMPAEIERHSRRLSIVPVIHSLLAAEIGIDDATASRLAASERRALMAAKHVVAVGAVLVGPLEQYGVDRRRIAVVSPGTDRAPLARGSESTDALHLVTVATLNPGKGHDVLFRALAALTDRPADARPTSDSSVGAAGHWRLTCAGSAARHPATAKRLRALLSELALTDRVTLAGELDAAATAALYDDADLAVLPTLSESHSLAAAEALARGIPVVGTRTGAIPDLVGEGDTAAGLLVEPGDVEALRDAVAHVIDDPCCRARLAEGARRVRENLRTWDDAVREMDSLMVSLSNHDLGAHPSTGSG